MRNPALEIKETQEILGGTYNNNFEEFSRKIGNETEDFHLFHSLADISPDGVVIHVDGEIVYANRAIINLLGCHSNTDLIGQTIFKFFTPDAQEAIEYRLDGIRTEGLRLPFYEYSLVRKNGCIIRVEICGQPIIWHGRTAVQSIIRDLTIRYEKDEQFRTLSRAVEQCPDAVIITDENGVVEYVNPYFEERSGFTFSEMEGKSFAFFRREIVQKNVFSDLRKVVTEGRVWRGEFSILSKTGKKYWEQASVSPVFSKDNLICHYICMLKDITERKQTEEKLELALKTSEAASAAKSAFLANMSHEFRTPLNAIIGFSSMLANSKGEFTASKVKEYASYTLDGGEHMLQLVNDLLDLAKIESNLLELQEQEFVLSELVQNVVKLVGGKAEENNCALSVTIKNEIYLMGDHRRVKQVLLNLAYNAIKFSEGERVDIVVGEGGMPKINVIDTGIGMSDPEINIALSPFGQAEAGAFSKKYDGAGLGLPIAANLMDLHGGELVIQSTKGKGTNVTMAFPISRRCYKIQTSH
ncbi:MAG: PAS domain-containing sensor histidine kinase [Sneathiella sp.]|nr:PAS domain-containing sensor histidine kinase [Sneathiella sp.]